MKVGRKLGAKLRELMTIVTYASLSQDERGRLHHPPRWVAQALLPPRGLNLRSVESPLATSRNQRLARSRSARVAVAPVRADHFGRLTTGHEPPRSTKTISAPMNGIPESALPNCCRVFVPRGSRGRSLRSGRVRSRDARSLAELRAVAATHGVAQTSLGMSG